ncbi:MAG: mechanosensitive ion channel domain-containing protein [Geminicoccaceae bacterium]
MVRSKAGYGWRHSVLAGALCLCAWLLLTPTALLAQTGESSPPSPASEVDAKLQALLDVLEDDKARAELIEKLNALTGREPKASEAAPAPISLARKAAHLTRSAAEEASSLTGQIWQDVRGFGEVISDGIDPGRLIGKHAELIGIITLTFTVLIALRLLRRPLLARAEAEAERSGTSGSALWLAVALLIDALAAFLAFISGYGLALTVFGESGRIGVEQSLFLNGFLAVELVKTALRGAISPRSKALRFLPINDRTAGFAYRRSSAVISIIGYGVLVAAPLVTIGISSASGRATAVLAMTVALILTLLGIWRLKALLADKSATGAGFATDDRSAAGDRRDDLPSHMLSILDRTWPWLTSLYAIGVFVIAVSRPAEGLPFVLGATVRSVLAIMVGAGLMALIGRLIRKGMPLPSPLRSNQMQLSRRLDRLVPNLLNALRLIVSVAVALTVIDAFGIFDVGGWLHSESGETLVGVTVSVVLVVALAYLIWLGLMSWIEYRLSNHPGHVAGARERTLLSLFANAITIALAAIAIMLVLSELGIEIGPLLAGAGVVGLAIGFGAQKLVQDIITGVFIQFENAINTDDVVTVAGTTGVVERLSIRSIGLRDVAGTYHLIPFSAVDQVSNFNRGFAYHVADIGIAYKESVPEAKEAMQAAFDRLKESEFGMHLLGDLEMLGVEALGDSAVVLRGRLRTAPGQQWGVGRAYNELVKEVFDERGIDIPFPHMTLFLGTDKEGRTQLDTSLQAPA